MEENTFDAALQSLLEVISDGVILMSSDGLIVDVNEAAAALFEYSRAELQGAPVTLLMPPEHAAHHPRYLQNYQASGKGSIIGRPRELQGLKRSGQRFPMELNLGSGDVRGNKVFAAIVRDLTQRNQMLNALLAFKEKTEMAGLLGGLGIWEWDLRTEQISFGNSAMFGIGAAKLQIDYSLFIDAVYVEDREMVAAALQECRTKNIEIDIVYRVIWYGDSLRWIRHQLTAIVDGQGKAQSLMGFVQDITSSKNYELELVQARSLAEAANASKTLFLSNMNHELRTPLNAILGFNQLLEREDFGVLSEGQKACVSRISSAGDYLMGLIEGVLDFNLIEANCQSLSPNLCRVNKLTGESLKMLDGLAAQHRIELNFETLPNDSLIYVDPIRFRQVITNFLSNAIKYGGDDKCVTVKLEERNKRIVVHVLDEGAGIGPEFRSKLFVPLERQAQHASLPGFGLGLALAKRLVEAMDGVIGCDNRPSQGADFWFSFPVREAGAAAASNTRLKREHQHAANSASVRVLYLSDNSYESHLIRNLLRTQPNVQLKMSFDLCALEQDIFDYAPGLLFVDTSNDIDVSAGLLTNIVKYHRGLNLVAFLPEHHASEKARFEQLGCSLVFARPFDLGSVHFHVTTLIKNFTPYALQGSRIEPLQY